MTYISEINVFQHVAIRLRDNRLEVFCKKGILRNFTKFSGKHLCLSLFFNKVAGLCRLKFLRTPFYIEHIWWLRLSFLIFSLKVLKFQINILKALSKHSYHSFKTLFFKGRYSCQRLVIKTALKTFVNAFDFLKRSRSFIAKL